MHGDKKNQTGFYQIFFEHSNQNVDFKQFSLKFFRKFYLNSIKNG